METANVEPSVAILGLGPVGRAFARDLRQAGLDLLLWSRNAKRGRELAGERDRVVPTLAEASRAGTVLLCVRDDALASVARELAASRGEGRIALHPNGYLGLEVLEPLAANGWETGKLHPLAPFPPDEDRAGCLRGAWCAFDGSEAARARARELALSVGAHSLPITPGAPAGRYHAAAALLAGGLTALVSLADDLARSSFEDDAGRRAAYLSLARATLANIESDGVTKALTGPVSRGTAELVQGHLTALSAAVEAPEAADSYRILGRRMAALAAARGSLDDQALSSILALLR